MSLTIKIRGLVFRGTAGAKRDGFYVDPDGFTGWDDGVDVRRDMHERPQAHGSFDVAGFLASRVVEIGGRCYASSLEKLEQSGNDLTALLAQGDSGQVIVENRGVTAWGNARLAARTEFRRIPGGIPCAQYHLQLWFADPRKYGESRSFAGGTASFHRGNFRAIPVHTVTGSMGSGYTITGPQGRQFTVTTALTTGHPHTIDMATGILSIDGSPVYGAVTQGDTWVINAGTQVVHTLSGSGGSLSTTLRDTSI